MDQGELSTGTIATGSGSVGRLRPVRVLPPRPVEVIAGEFGAAHPPTRARPRGTRRRWVALGLGVVAVSAGVLGLVGASLAKKTPAWWSPIDPDNAGAQAKGRQLENGIATLLTKVRGEKVYRAGRAVETPEAAEGEVWTVALKAEDANAWLATRLRVWLENESEAHFHWPESVKSVQVRFEGGVITVGASIERSAEAGGGAGQPAQVLSATLSPEFRADGSFWMPARWVSVGRLSLPAAWMLSVGTVGEGSGGKDLASLPQTRDVLATFAGRLAVMRTPVIRIGDGRRVRLESLESRDGRLLITCRTLGRDQGKTVGK